MATENKFDKLRSMVHQGVPLEKPVQETEPESATMETKVETDAPVVADVVMKTGTGKDTKIKAEITPQSIAPDEKAIKGEIDRQSLEPAVELDEKEVRESVEPAITVPEPVRTQEPASKPVERRKRKPQADYQSLFFNRIDFTNRKPLYITAVTHRRLMRIVHLMDESKATISSYVENIILNHLEMFKEDIDIIYQTNNINPVE